MQLVECLGSSREDEALDLQVQCLVRVLALLSLSAA